MRVLWSLVVLCLVALGGGNGERGSEHRTDRVEEALNASPNELASRVGAHPTTSRLGEPERSRALPLAIVVERFALAPQAVVALVEREAAPAVVTVSSILVGSARGPPTS